MTLLKSISFCLLFTILIACGTEKATPLTMSFDSPAPGTARSLRLVLGDKTSINLNGQQVTTKVDFDKNTKVSVLKNEKTGEIISEGVLVNTNSRYFWSEKQADGNYHIGMVKRTPEGLIGFDKIQEQMMILDSLRTAGAIQFEQKTKNGPITMDKNAVFIVGASLNKALDRFPVQAIKSNIDWNKKADGTQKANPRKPAQKLIDTVEQMDGKLQIMLNDPALTTAELWTADKTLMASSSAQGGALNLDLDTVPNGQYILRVTGPKGIPEIQAVRVDK